MALRAAQNHLYFSNDLLRIQVQVSMQCIILLDVFPGDAPNMDRSGTYNVVVGIFKNPI